MSNSGRGRGTVGLGRRTRWTLCVGLSAALVAFFAPLASASDQGAAATHKAAKPVTAGKISPAQITTSSDKALKKLDPKLRKAYRKHNGATVAVFVSVVGNPKSVTRKLDRAHSTKSGNVSLVVGRVPAGQLVKLASDPKVLSVRQVTLSMDGTPVAASRHRRTPAERRGQGEGRRRPSRPPTSPTPTPRRRAGRRSTSSRSSTSSTPRPTTSPPAWKDGVTGKGTTVAVFDGGTDWSHPDLIGAKVAKSRKRLAGGVRPVRHPAVAGRTRPDRRGPELVRRARRPATCARRRRHLPGGLRDQDRPVAQPGEPARDERRTPTRFPAGWSKSGNVRLGSHPDDYALDFFGERPAFLVTDPNTAGVYDTIYVDLNDDYNFSDEKPVTKESPRSWRDLDGDGFVDLSGGMAYYISDGTGDAGTPVPGGLEEFGAGDQGRARARSSPGPATSTPASRVTAPCAPATSSARA